MGTSGYRRWGIATAAKDAGALSFGYYDNNANPHYSSGGNAGYTGTGSKMWLATTGSLSTTSQGVLWGATNDGSGSGLVADYATKVTFNTQGNTNTTLKLLLGDPTNSTIAAGTVYKDNELSYNTSSNTLYAAVFSGNVTGNVSGSSGSCTGSAGSVGGITSNRIVYGGTARKSTQVSTFAGVNEVTGFYYGSGVTGAPTTDWINYMHSAGNSWSSSNNYSFQLTHAFQLITFGLVELLMVASQLLGKYGILLLTALAQP